MPTPAPYAYISHKQDAFSGTYIRAVCAVAGCGIEHSTIDNDKIDYTTSSRVMGTVRTKPKIDIQAKCQLGPAPTTGEMSYSLDLDTYNNLRDPLVSNPRILVVVYVPVLETEWALQTQTELALRHCGYWLSLKGLPPSTNTTSQTVYVPTINMFTAQKLKAMMQDTANGIDIQ